MHLGLSAFGFELSTADSELGALYGSLVCALCALGSALSTLNSLNSQLSTAGNCSASSISFISFLFRTLCALPYTHGTKQVLSVPSLTNSFPSQRGVGYPFPRIKMNKKTPNSTTDSSRFQQRTAYRYMLCALDLKLSTVSCQHMKNTPASYLESALTQLLQLKSPGISTYEKIGGRGVVIVNLPASAAPRGHKQAGADLQPPGTSALRLSNLFSSGDPPTKPCHYAN